MALIVGNHPKMGEAMSEITQRQTMIEPNNDRAKQ
jgi:hypothetical protein